MTPSWQQAKKHIQSLLPQNTFSLWIDPISVLDITDNRILLGCPNKFSRNWVMDNYLDLIQGLFDPPLRVELVYRPGTGNSAPAEPPAEPVPKQMPLPHLNRCGLLDDFTFDRFVVGRSNEFAYSASNAMADKDTWDYHCLLMLAETGLGKTHLSHAVGHRILKNNPRCRVFYMTAEDFTNEMIGALKSNRIEQFKNKFRRGCDVLLLEEVHFLSGKQKIQMELGYTLDALANDRKKVVFTSSLAPKDIPKMSSTLASRLTSGLVTTIDGPDYDTRVNIVKKKAAEHHLVLSAEITEVLAGRLKRDIRQLESALTCLKAKSELVNARIDVDLATEVVDCLVSGDGAVTADTIKDLVSTYFKVDPDLLKSRSRKKTIAYPRNIYIYLCRMHTDDTLEAIAGTVGRSHSSIIYASERVAHDMKTNTKLKRQVEFLSQKIQEREEPRASERGIPAYSRKQ